MKLWISFEQGSNTRLWAEFEKDIKNEFHGALNGCDRIANHWSTTSWGIFDIVAAPTNNLIFNEDFEISKRLNQY